MKNAGRDKVRDRRAGWLTCRVLRRPYHRISSHDAITEPSSPPRLSALPPTLAFDIQGPEGCVRVLIGLTCVNDFVEHIHCSFIATLATYRNSKQFVKMFT